MPIKLGTTALDSLMLGATQVAKVLLGTTIVWEHLVPKTKSVSFNAYSHSGTPHGGGGTSFTIPEGGRITYLSTGSAECNYYVYAKVNSSDSWTTLARSSKINTAITDKKLYYYFYFGAEGVTYHHWEDPAGNYWWCTGSLTVSYMGKPS